MRSILIGGLALLVVANMAAAGITLPAPGVSAAPAWCTGWTMAGNASCNGNAMTAGQFDCYGNELSGDAGSASAAVSGVVSSVSFHYHMVTTDNVAFDGIFVQIVGPLNSARFTFNPGALGGCGTFDGDAVINIGATVNPTAPLQTLQTVGNAVAGVQCALGCTMTIGVYEDGFGDDTGAVISNVVVA
ncbi:MAG: hypothetical protein LC624_09595 [Halobacteriales archaeon]|nr:hypothetical protein [Halobacteriales archaeon]